MLRNSHHPINTNKMNEMNEVTDKHRIITTGEEAVIPREKFEIVLSDDCTQLIGQNWRKNRSLHGDTQLAKLVDKFLIGQKSRNRSLDEGLESFIGHAIREEISENVVADIHCLVSFEMKNELEQNMTRSLLVDSQYAMQNQTANHCEKRPFFANMAGN